MITKEKIYNLLQKDGLVYKKTEQSFFALWQIIFHVVKKKSKTSLPNSKKMAIFFEEKKSKMGGQFPQKIIKRGCL